MQIHVWDATTGRELLRLPVGALEATALAFGPDGTRLAVGCSRGELFVLEADRWAE